MDRRSWKLLLWTALAGVVFALLGLGKGPENYLRMARNSLHWRQASGDIVLVDIDDNSLKDVGHWPWSRSRHAQIVDQLTRAGAKRIFIDIMMEGPSLPREDALFANALARSKRVVLPAITRSGHGNGWRVD